MTADPLKLLVPTKLTTPKALASWVLRTRLIDRLMAIPHARLILVVAPAGFGKSTLVAQWLSGVESGEGRIEQAEQETNPSSRSALPSQFKVAWLRLDEYDQDPLRFLAYVVGAIEQVAPRAVTTTHALLAAADPPPPYVVVQTLLAELSALSDGLTLVLDDYHLITAPSVHQTVAYFLRHLPPPCRLVVLSRWDPPLSLMRLRAEGHMCELRAADLRFTEAETRAVLARLSGSAPVDTLVTALYQQTEGWAIAVQLAALAQAAGRPPDLVLRLATRQLAEYLADEVIGQQSETVQQALLALAVPERFCAGLCAALLGMPADVIGAESLLEKLLDTNLLLVPLDAERRWYRFHHLFREILLQRLQLTVGTTDLRALQLLAAHWLAHEGLAEEAVRMYLAAGAEDAAASLVEDLLTPEVGKDVASAPPSYWLGLLPEHMVARRPGLALITARLALFSWDIDRFEASLAHLDALLVDPGGEQRIPPWPSFQADYTALHGLRCFFRGQPGEAISLMQAALEQRPNQALTTQIALQLGLAYVGVGAYKEGVRLVSAPLPQVVAQLGGLNALYQHSCLASMHQLAGQLDAQRREAQQLAERAATREQGDLWVGYAARHLGLIAYERSELTTAAANYTELTRRKYKVSYPAYMGGVVGMALVAAAQRAFDEAAEFVHQALAFADEAGGAFLRYQALGCATRVALARGDTAAALAYAKGIGRDIHLGPSMALETPRLTQVRALIAEDDPSHLADAQALLDSCLNEVKPLHNIRLLIAALALQALLEEVRGRRAEALATLGEAVALAAPRGFVRTFIDLGPQVLELLHALAAQGVAPTYLEHVLTVGTTSSAQSLFPPPVPGPALTAGVLTRREVEVLALLAERWSNKEIAERLVITVNTVRRHTTTIYDKLGVGSRREAVAAARALGLLSQR